MIVKYRYKSDENIMRELKSKKNKKPPENGGFLLIIVS
jgi:hypothetical protein